MHNHTEKTCCTAMGVHNPNLQTYTHVSYHCAKNKAKHIYPLAKFEKILLFLFEKVIGGFFISLLLFIV